MLKKFLSLFMSLTMIFALSIPVFASEPTAQSFIGTALPEEAPSHSSSDSQDIVSIALETANEDTFGGIYYDENGDFVYCTTNENDLAAIPATLQSANTYILYKTVKYSLAELEAMKESLEPYMLEYDITMLDASERLNKVTIETTSSSAELVSFVNKIIQYEDAYEISIRPSNIRIAQSEGVSLEEVLQSSTLPAENN